MRLTQSRIEMRVEPKWRLLKDDKKNKARRIEMRKAIRDHFKAKGMKSAIFCHYAKDAKDAAGWVREQNARKKLTTALKDFPHRRSVRIARAECCNMIH